jgi:flagellar basal-body rod modification protein FlgD
MNPMDDTQSVSQLAQFSALQASDNLETSFANFQSNFAVLQSSQLIGKAVTVNTTDATTGNTSSLSGTVSAISVVNGVPQLTLTDANGNVITGTNGAPETFTTSQITGIQ